MMRKILLKALNQNPKFSLFLRALRLLPVKDRKNIVIVNLLQVCSAALDLLGLGVVGILGSLAVRGVASKGPGDRVSYILELLHLGDKPIQYQATILGITAATLFVIRTILSMVLSRITLFYLSKRSSALSSELTGKVLSGTLTDIQQMSVQEILYALTTGVNVVTVGLLGSFSILFTDTILLVFLVIGLLVLDFKIALITILLFAIVGYLLFRFMHQKARKFGLLESSLGIESNEEIFEVLLTFRESIVRNTRGYYINKIGQLRLAVSDSIAELSFMPNISKYVIEAIIILGTLIIAGLAFLTQDASRAIASISVFLAAGTRIAPAVLRIQQGLIGIRSSSGIAEPTLQLIEKYQDSVYGLPNNDVNNKEIFEHNDFIPVIEVTDLSYTYPGKEINAIDCISLSLKAGQLIAIVGPSGAGKTTFVDLLLGALRPSHGDIQISGCNPLDAVEKWPGAIGYVPQDVVVSKRTVGENISLGFPVNYYDENEIWRALRTANLDTLIKEMPGQLDAQLGDRGTSISGGQRQRIGIARALYTNPKLLVLDEATSALDSESEKIISESIQELRGNVTVVMIAHRLSTVRDADVVIYMDFGKVISMGTFDEVRSNVPNFDSQAKLMGL
jgi:ABC-type multidrug transport system fused ATPase/permease subunit